jgi:hypothetical protein
VILDNHGRKLEKLERDGRKGRRNEKAKEKE